MLNNNHLLYYNLLNNQEDNISERSSESAESQFSEKFNPEQKH